MKVKYTLLHKDKDTKARYGTLETNYGKFETPMFMPVGTQATVKTLDPEEIKEIGAGVILSNTYHLWLRPGEDIVAKAGGLHKFMNYDGPILTDCGGFQVFSLAKPKDISEDGVVFKSHINGERLFLTPEKSIEIQNKLDSDIAMSFDECPPYPVTHEYMKNSVERTIRWAKRGKAVFNNPNQSLFGIVQGGEFEDLREWSCKETVKLGFDGYSIGGTSVGEDKPTMYKMIEYGIKYLPEDKPRYLMGVGEPTDLFEGVERGVDMFDCVMPTRNGRNGMLFTKNGIMNMRNKKWEDDYSPIEAEGASYVDTMYSRAYLRHLFHAQELLAMQIASIHNLAFYLWLAGEARKHIIAGDFSTWKPMMVKRLSTRL